jgi:hypothetical protein
MEGDVPEVATSRSLFSEQYAGPPSGGILHGQQCIVLAYHVIIIKPKTDTWQHLSQP